MISLLSTLGLTASTFFKGRACTIILAVLAVIGIVTGAVLHTQKTRLETQLSIANETISRQNSKLTELASQLAIHDKAVQQAEANYRITKNLLEQERLEFNRTKKGLEQKIKRWDAPEYKFNNCSDTMNILRQSAKDKQYVY